MLDLLDLLIYRDMDIFVNVYERSTRFRGEYFVYRLYSGKSEDDIKVNIITDIINGMDPGDYDDNDKYGYVEEMIRELPRDLSFNEIANGIAEIIKEELIDNDSLHDYSLIIGDATTDVSDALDFYVEYKVAKENEEYNAIEFSFLGNNPFNIQSLFPYLYTVIKDYGVIIDGDDFNRLSKNLI